MLGQLAAGNTKRLVILAGVVIIGLGFLYLLGRSFAAENTNPAATCLDNEERFYSKGMENVRQSLENRLRSRFGKDSVVKSLDVLEKSQAYNSDFLTVEASFVLDVPRSPDERGTLTAKMTKECNVISLNLEY